MISLCFAHISPQHYKETQADSPVTAVTLYHHHPPTRLLSAVCPGSLSQHPQAPRPLWGYPGML